MKSTFEPYRYNVDHQWCACCPSGNQYQAQVELVNRCPVALVAEETGSWARDGIEMENVCSLLVQSF